MVAGTQVRRGRFLLVLGLLGVGAAAWACGGSGNDGEPASGGPVEVRVVADDAGGELRFEPEEIRARVGQTVRLVLDNKGLALHDFSVMDMPVRMVMEEGAAHGAEGEMALHVASDPGQTGALEFVPVEPGTYTFFCSVEGHRDAGMEGRIIVS